MKHQALSFYAAGVVLLFALAACARFGVFKDPTAQAIVCDVADVAAPLLNLVTELNVPLNIIQTIYEDLCGSAVARGMSQADAQKFALDAVRNKVAQYKLMGVKFPAGDGGVR